MLKRGTKLVNEDNNLYYVKLEDIEWAWWRLEDFNKDEHKRMQVNLEDDDVVNNGYYSYKLIKK